MKLMRGTQWPTVQALSPGHVEIGLIYRSHLDQRRKTAEHFMYLLRILAIAIRMPVYKNRLRTELRRRPQRHGRVHAKLPRRIGSGGDHAPFVPLPAYHHRLAFQRRIKQFFDGHEEGVHIHVKDGARGGAHRSPGCLAEVYRDSVPRIGCGKQRNLNVEMTLSMGKICEDGILESRRMENPLKLKRIHHIEFWVG